MTDFNVDFNNLKNQIIFADLSDEQIQQLRVALQEKMTTKNVQLTREEKVFYQCCREHRSYHNNQDIDKVICPKCGSVHICKNGTRNGKQRYKCKDCGKSFGDTAGTVVFKSKLSINTWIDFIKMTLQKESCRTIAKNLGIHRNTVLYNRHRICAVLLQSVCNQDDFKSLAEGDEYYYPLSFKDKKDPMFFLGTLGRMPYTHLSAYRRLKYVLDQGFPQSFLDHLDENEELCRNELLHYVDQEDLDSQEKFSNAINHMNADRIIQVLKTLNEQQKKKRGISNQQVCCLTCVDRNQNYFLKPVCVGRLWASHVERNLIPHFSNDTVLVTDSHSAYKTVANKYKIPLKQIPSGKHKLDGYHLGHVNGYHHNLSDFLYPYHGVSSKYLDYYLSLFYWKEKNKGTTYQEQAYEIMTLLSEQAKKIPLRMFSSKSILFDLKGILGKG